MDYTDSNQAYYKLYYVRLMSCFSGGVEPYNGTRRIMYPVTLYVWLYGHSEKSNL